MRIINVSCFLFIFLLQINSLYGQNQNDAIDSLTKVIEKKSISTHDKIDTYNLLAKKTIQKDSVTFMAYIEKAIQLSEENNYPEGFIDANSILGDFYSNNKQYDKADSIYQKMIENSKKNNYKKGEANATFSLGNSFFRRNNNNEALEYYNKALNLYKGIDNKLLSRCHLLIADTYRRLGNYDKALASCEKAIKIQERFGYNESLADTYYSMAFTYQKKGDTENTLVSYRKALAIYEELGNKVGMVNVYNGLGIEFKTQSRFAEALSYYQKSLKISQEIESMNIGGLYSNIGNIHYALRSPELALEYYEKGLEVYVKTGDRHGMSSVYMNMGGLYADLLKDYEKGISYFEKSLQILEEVGDKSNTAMMYQNLAILNIELEEYKESLEYAKLSLELVEDLEEKWQFPPAHYVLGLTYYYLEDYSKAIKELDKAVDYSRIQKNPQILNAAAEYLSKIYSSQGKYKLAYENHVLFKLMSDSLSNTENTKKITRMESEFAFKQIEDSLQQVNQIKTEQIEKEKLKNSFQRNINILILIILVVVVLSAIYIYRSRGKEKKLNKTLHQQKEKLHLRSKELTELNEELQVLNEEIRQNQEEVIAQRDSIEAQNVLLEKQHQNITHSINAAQTIQEAILPFDERMKKELPEHFLIYQPRDVVSGDFYWLGHQEGKTIIGALDCTGHGVPGAFMSMIGVTLLNEVINTKKITEPDAILEELRKEVKRALRQNETGNSNGMDALFVTLENIESESITKVTFAGAKRPLWYIEPESKKIQEIKGSNISIGVNYKDERKVTSTSVLLPKDSLLYFGSDGIIDQNNEKRKKFGTAKLKKFFEEHQELSLKEQKQMLEEELKEHMKMAEQRDDMLWVGMKI